MKNKLITFGAIGISIAVTIFMGFILIGSTIEAATNMSTFINP